MESNAKRVARVVSSTGLLVLVAAVAIGSAGCEYLGLSGGGGEQQVKKKDESSGGGGGSDDGDESGSQQGDDKKKKAKKKKKEATGDQEGSGSDLPTTVGESGSGGESDEETTSRNPFAGGPPSESEASDESDEETDKTLPPTQRHPYTKYRLAGVISEVSVPKVMFIDPKGVGHMLKEGDKIGKNGNVIADIRGNEVELEIPPEGEEGESRSTVLQLRKEEAPSSEEGEEELSEEEKETLRRLMESEQGREEMRKQMREQSGDGEGGSGTRGMAPPE